MDSATQIFMYNISCGRDSHVFCSVCGTSESFKGNDIEKDTEYFLDKGWVHRTGVQHKGKVYNGFICPKDTKILKKDLEGKK